MVSFHPAKMPAFTRRNYARELTYSFLFSTALAMIEGGIIGVIVKNAFTGTADRPPVVPEVRLNFIVAFLMAAPEFANITSFLWTAAAHGRRKVRFINVLQAITILLIGAIAMVPRSEAGLYVLCGILVAARVCLTGVVTLRSTLWRANYTRHHRARATGKFSTISVLVIAATGFIVGSAMEQWEESFRVLIPAACLLGSIGVWRYGQIRVRGHAAMLRAERTGGRADRPSFNPVALVRLLARDRWYAGFQACMFTLGAGNIMLSAPLVITLKEQFQQGYVGGIAVMNSIPLLVMPWAIPLWARLLARTHVVRFRALHSWVFVLGQAIVVAGVMTGTFWLLPVAMVVQGFGFAGGTLAWNLGHLDFAPVRKATEYMGVHVTLNGVRGIAAPFLAVSIYEGLERVNPGSGVWVFVVSVALCIAGGAGFGFLAKAMGDAARAAPRET